MKVPDTAGQAPEHGRGMRAAGIPSHRVDRAHPAAPRGAAGVWKLTVLLALVAAACGGGAAGAGPDAETAPRAGAEAQEARNGETGEQQAVDRPSTAELEAIYRARTDSARLRFTAADVHFMTGMIVHHGQALVMAAMVPERTSTRQMRTLAARIDNGQKDEIATMQRWLRDRAQPVPEVGVEGTELVVRWEDGRSGRAPDAAEHGAGEHAAHGGDEHPAHGGGTGQDHMRMAGMLTPEQMRDLASARGAEFDRLFLTYMIQHHQGAVDMVHELFGTDGAAQDEAVFRIASDIQVDQRTEIARMERMLEAMSTEGEGR